MKHYGAIVNAHATAFDDRVKTGILIRCAIESDEPRRTGQRHPGQELCVAAGAETDGYSRAILVGIPLHV